MGLTIIEQDTMHAIQNACREISKQKKIDWEQRRYEIAKDVISVVQRNTPEEMAEVAVNVADALIAELKKKSKEQIKIG